MSHLFYDFMFQQHNMNKEGRNVSIIRERERERERKREREREGGRGVVYAD